MKHLPVTAAFLLLPTICLADHTGGHIGIGLNLTEAEIGNESYGISAAQIQLGTTISDNLALDGRVSIGISDDSITTNSNNRTLSQGLGLQLTAKPYVAVGKRATAYGILGYSLINFELKTGTGTTIKDDTQGYTWGAGVDYLANANMSIQFEISRFTSDIQNNGASADVELTSINFGTTFTY